MPLFYSYVILAYIKLNWYDQFTFEALALIEHTGFGSVFLSLV